MEDSVYMRRARMEANILQGFADAQKLLHDTARKAGWYQNPETGEVVDRSFGEVIALMHSELSEALEAYRKDKLDDHLPDRLGVEVELADCIIRILDTAEYLGLDIGDAILAKNRYNEQRQDHKLENRAKTGGKKF